MLPWNGFKKFKLTIICRVFLEETKFYNLAWVYISNIIIGTHLRCVKNERFRYRTPLKLALGKHNKYSWSSHVTTSTCTKTMNRKKYYARFNNAITATCLLERHQPLRNLKMLVACCGKFWLCTPLVLLSGAAGGPGPFFLQHVFPPEQWAVSTLSGVTYSEFRSVPVTPWNFIQ